MLWKTLGIPRTISIRKISSLQIKIFVCKGCKVFVVHVLDNEKEESMKDTENFPILQEFQGVLQEITRLPPKREIYFSIDLLPGTVPISKDPKAPY